MTPEKLQLANQLAEKIKGYEADLNAMQTAEKHCTMPYTAKIYIIENSIDELAYDIAVCGYKLPAHELQLFFAKRIKDVQRQLIAAQSEFEAL